MVECLPSSVNRGSNVFYGKTKRTSSRHARHAHLADASSRSRSWSRDRKAHPADHERFSADAAWFSLSCTASPGGKRLGYLEVGDCPGSQSGVQVLPAYGNRQKTTCSRRVAMEADGGSCGACHVARRRGELT